MPSKDGDHVTFRHIFIAVMGMTGVGKSTLIKNLTRSDDVIVGHGVESCTSVVSAHTFQHGQYIVNLIDTPGFNDTNRSDTEILKEVAVWLATTYRARSRLTGIIYLHRISDNRMGGSAILNLNMFKLLCGDDCLPNVVLATTMWSDPHHAQQEFVAQELRETELTTKAKFWGGLSNKGATITRYDNTLDSALRIVAHLEHQPEIVLDIQRQIVEEHLTLVQTPAGRFLNEEILLKEEELKHELETAREQMNDALREKDENFAAETKKEMVDIKTKLAQAEIDRGGLHTDLEEKLEEREEQIQRLANMAEGFGLRAAATRSAGGLGVLGLAAFMMAGGPAELAGVTTAALAKELGERVLLFTLEAARGIVSSVEPLL
ncbi:MAG: hypothetical protein M4579_003729 [Chaenotheca gracillima]|nr:MAG: hypothetical protein M4579_003729 [Chaenotheca gracillima]